MSDKLKDILLVILCLLIWAFELVVALGACFYILKFLRILK